MKHSKRTNDSKSKTAVGYVRVSTEEQVEGGVSLEAQESALRAYCTMRGITLIEVVCDAGISAGKPLSTRTGGARVIELARRGTVGSVIAWKLDRLFRDCADCLTVTGEWDKREIALHLVDMGGQAIDTSTAMGRFFLTVMAGATEMERNLIRERTSTSMAYKKSKGERVGQVPYGYKLAADGITLEHDPEEQDIIFMVKGMRADGLTLQAITDKLNSDNVPARGEKWHLTTVARILKRAA